jgi:uncharacterized protein YegP (UPF0339 family)
METLPRFEIRRGRFSRKWRFVLIGENGEIIATSEHYNSKAAAKIGITAVRVCAPQAELVDTDTN